MPDRTPRRGQKPRPPASPPPDDLKTQIKSTKLALIEAAQHLLASVFDPDLIETSNISQLAGATQKLVAAAATLEKLDHEPEGSDDEPVYIEIPGLRRSADE